MWVKSDKGVHNLESGHALGVRQTPDNRDGGESWEVTTQHPSQARAGVQVLQGGYRSEDEAKNALDEFLTANDINAVELQRPTTDEETDDGTEEVNTDDGGVDRGPNVGKAPAVIRER